MIKDLRDKISEDDAQTLEMKRPVIQSEAKNPYFLNQDYWIKRINGIIYWK